MGCIGKSHDDPIGVPVDVIHYRPLHRTAVPALLDANSNRTMEKQQGWAVATSDNALLYGHRLDPDGHIAVQYGAMVQTLVGGLQVGTDYSEIHPPPEIHVPFMHPSIDELYAAALWEELSKSTDRARRLGRAIDWLDIAWRNTVSN